MANMEHNGGNQNMGPLATLCRMGCGFYGNSTFDGMCSKCYKDVMKRRQQNTSPTQTSVSSGRMSPAVSAASAIAEVVSSSTDTGPTSSLTITSSSSSVSSNGSSSVSGGSNMVTSTTPSIDTATPTVPSALPSDNTHDKDELAEGGAEVSTENKDKESGDKDKKPKKNRCHTCKKKVGLTGFECRCGGLYCGLHRYSDKHNCTFNYKEMAQEQIRKNNPVVVGQKIQKI